MDATSHKEGRIAVRDVVVGYYAGDPSTGGALLPQQTVAEAIPSSVASTFEATRPNLPSSRSIVVCGIVDPLDAIEECSNADNNDAADNPLCCDRGAAVASASDTA